MPPSPRFVASVSAGRRDRDWVFSCALLARHGERRPGVRPAPCCFWIAADLLSSACSSCLASRVGAAVPPLAVEATCDDAQRCDDNDDSAAERILLMGPPGFSCLRRRDSSPQGTDYARRKQGGCCQTEFSARLSARSPAAAGAQAGRLPARRSGPWRWRKKRKSRQPRIGHGAIAPFAGAPPAKRARRVSRGRRGEAAPHGPGRPLLMAMAVYLGCVIYVGWNGGPSATGADTALAYVGGRVAGVVPVVFAGVGVGLMLRPAAPVAARDQRGRRSACSPACCSPTPRRPPALGPSGRAPRALRARVLQPSTAARSARSSTGRRRRSSSASARTSSPCCSSSPACCCSAGRPFSTIAGARRVRHAPRRAAPAASWRAPHARPAAERDEGRVTDRGQRHRALRHRAARPDDEDGHEIDTPRSPPPPRRGGRLGAGDELRRGGQRAGERGRAEAAGGRPARAGQRGDRGRAHADGRAPPRGHRVRRDRLHRAERRSCCRRASPTRRRTRAGHKAVGKTLLEALGALRGRGRDRRHRRRPHVSRFELRLAPGTKVSKITQLKDDLAYALASTDIRILAPIPGKQAVGVEVPNQRRKLVRLGDIYAGPPAGLLAARRLARQGHRRPRRLDRPREDAPRPDRRHDRLGQVGQHQRDPLARSCCTPRRTRCGWCSSTRSGSSSTTTRTSRTC